MEVGEQVTAELWASFGGQQRSEELATATPLRPRFWRERETKEEMDASTSPGVSSWRSCGRPELTSGAKDGVRVPNVAAALTPVGHVDELGVHSDKAMVV